MQEELFEWIVICGKKEYCLTEAQYQMLIKQQNQKLVLYDNFSINPAYVTSAYKQPIRRLLKLYPCAVCGASGVLIKEEKDKRYIQEVCPRCNGSKVDFSKKSQIVLALTE